MTRCSLVSAIIALTLGLTTIAAAQIGTDECGFEHPQRAKLLKASLVQRYFCVSYNPQSPTCRGLYPNAMTEDGTPSSVPPLTEHEAQGSPTDGWLWNEGKGQGTLQLKASKNVVVHPLTPPHDSADIEVSLKLQGVVDTQGPATGPGTVIMFSNVTIRDRQGTPDDGDPLNGDENVDDVAMTLFLPIIVPFLLDDGHTTMKTTLNSVLNAAPMSQRGLPKCANLELIDVSVADENGSRFAAAGVFLPAK